MPALLVHVDDGLRFGDAVRSAGEVLHVGDQLVPLGGQNVDDVQILRLGLQQRGVGAHEMDVGVARIPALPAQVGPASQLDLQFRDLPLLDGEADAAGLVLDSLEDLHLVASRSQGQSEVGVDVGVGFVNYNHVSPHVLAPTDGDSPLVALRRPIGPLLIQNPDSSSHGLTAVPIAQVNPDQVQGLLFGVVHREFGRQVRAAFTVNVDDLPARVPPAQRQGQGRLGDAVGSVDQDRVDPDRVAHLLKVGEAEPDVGDLVHAPVQVFQVLLAGLALVRGQLRVQARSDCLHVPVQGSRWPKCGRPGGPSASPVVGCASAFAPNRKTKRSAAQSIDRPNGGVLTAVSLFDMDSSYSAEGWPNSSGEAELRPE